MSSSGEFFEAPARQPDFAPTDYDFSHERPHGIREQIWLPSDAENGEHRYIITSLPEDDSVIDRSHFLDIETVAAAGMRKVFERFGIRSFYQEETIVMDGIAAIRRVAAITFPSSDRHHQMLEEHAAKNKFAKLFTLADIGDEHYDGLRTVRAFREHQLLMAGEPEMDPGDDGSMYDLQLYSHDLRVHFPAWLCLPPGISTAICERGAQLADAYDAAYPSGWHYGDPAIVKEINRFGHVLDQTVNIWNMARLINGNNKTYNDNICELTNWRSGNYARMTLSQIASPILSEVLIASWK